MQLGDWYKTNTSALPLLSENGEGFINDWLEHGSLTEREQRSTHSLIVCLNRILGDRPWRPRSKNARNFGELLLELDAIIGPISKSLFDWRLTENTWLYGLSKQSGYHLLTRLSIHGLRPSVASKESLCLLVRSSTNSTWNQLSNKEIRVWLGVKPPVRTTLKGPEVTALKTINARYRNATSIERRRIASFVLTETRAAAG